MWEVAWDVSEGARQLCGFFEEDASNILEVSCGRCLEVLGSFWGGGSCVGGCLEEVWNKLGRRWTCVGRCVLCFEVCWKSFRSV